MRDLSWLSKRQIGVIWTCAALYTAAIVELVWIGDAVENMIVAVALPATVPPLLGWVAIVTGSWYRGRH